MFQHCESEMYHYMKYTCVTAQKYEEIPSIQ